MKANRTIIGLVKQGDQYALIVDEVTIAVFINLKLALKTLKEELEKEIKNEL